jgi:1-acyl-sn-glycerol-3-phosphate acyltransferase
MLYSFLKIFSRLASLFYCRRIIINDPERLNEKGPLLLACNHPNSFFDSIILDTLFKQPIWSLARGDVFKKPFYIKLLHSLKILPVYRTSEGVENLSENYKTFDACIGLFKKDQIVTIFSEGKCINEWHLRPLKKGTARLAFKAWEENIPLRVLPVGINYSSFRRFGKNVFINFGNEINATDFDLTESDGSRHLKFNERLQQELEPLVFEIRKEDLIRQKQLLSLKISVLYKTLLIIPAALGWLLHAPLYLPLRNFVWKRTHDNDHFDSVMTALLLVTYPFYLLLISLITIFISNNAWFFLAVLIVPVTAWSYVQLKSQLDRPLPKKL